MTDGVPRFFLEAAKVIASALALDAARSYSHIPGRLTEIFRGTIHEQLDDTIASHRDTYDSHVLHAVRRLANERCKCQFKDKDGVECMNVYANHNKIKQHQGRYGGFLGDGEFESSFVNSLLKSWRKVLVDQLESTETSIASHSHESDPSSTNSSQIATKVVWSIHEVNIRNLYALLPGLDTIKEPRTCYWCLRDAPSEVLPCRHAICIRCAKNFAPAQSHDPRIIELNNCLLHHEAKIFNPLHGSA